MTILIKIVMPYPNTVLSHLSLLYFPPIALIIMTHKNILHVYTYIYTNKKHTHTHFLYVLPHNNFGCIRVGISVCSVHCFISSIDSVTLTEWIQWINIKMILLKHGPSYSRNVIVNITGQLDWQWSAQVKHHFWVWLWECFQMKLVLNRWTFSRLPTLMWVGIA